ncbi:MAG: pyridoxal phosphate-dependent aminotransferase [Planctomycetes bacterium]|nr:pyridoxal phosphate-dependent aminotransferase [Planctomycetota bacterium]
MSQGPALPPTPLPLSERAAAIQPSATLAVLAEAARMREQDIDVVGFGAGEPDFDTPESVRGKAIEAIHEGFTRYTPTTGILPLRNAISQKLRDDQGLDYGPDCVLATPGGKYACHLAFQVTCNPGDEVLVPAPFWTSYPEQICLAQARPVVLETREADGFKLSPDALAAAVGPRTKMLVLNSPSNPTGSVYSREELAALGEALKGSNVLVLSDEIYEKIIFGDARHHSIAAVAPFLKDRTFLVGGVSKTYAMTGWRIGWLAGPREAIAAAARLADHTTSNPCSIAQKAALAALLGGDEPVRRMVAEFDKRRLYAFSRISQMPGLACAPPEGAFYLFPNVGRCYGRRIGETALSDSVSFARALLVHARVAVVPGIAFGADSHVRISYATSQDEIEKGLDRLEEFLARLS